MKKTTLQKIVVVLAAWAAVAAVVLRWIEAGDFDVPGLIVLSCVGQLTAMFLVRPVVNPTEDAIQAERDQLDQERSELDELKQTIEAELESRAKDIDQRELKLSNRLVAFQEWLEYPGADAVEGETETAPLATAELSAQDQQVIDLLDAEAKRLYEKLQEGYYQPDGKLDQTLIRDDALDLITRVAKIYQPDSENPLLETSVSDLLRAGSRVCLHLLITLEKLPFSLEDASIATLHGYVQKAVKAYGVYTAAEPYIGYASKALYAGRLALGANPLTLGITWALAEIGKRGAKAIGQKVVDQQAVALLGDLVRVVGFEVASIYSGDFRHRDSNWVYGSELTNLMSRFPISRENLAHALREVGGLTVRNEYDRVFLYRCLSTHRAAEPLVDAHTLLPPEQRQEITQRLEKFFRDFVHGRQPKRVAEWIEGVETRLGYRVNVDVDTTAASGAELSAQENAAAFESLIAMVCSVKARPVQELRESFHRLKLVQRIGVPEADKLLDELEQHPPHFFDPPDIDPDSDVLPDYFADLCTLAVRMPPFDVHPDDVVLETAAYFGRDIGKERASLDREYCEFLIERLSGEAASARISGAAARAFLAAPTDEAPISAIYSDVSVSWPERVSVPTGTVWLAGSQTRLILAIESDRDWIAISPAENFAAERVDGMIIDDCRLTGGAWTLPGQAESVDLTVTIAGAKLKRYDSWFAPLFEVIRPSNA